MIVIALQVTDRYVAMVLMCVAIWIVGQAMVNIGVVVGVFPVLGVPMPFVSAGGSSMIMCLTAAGLVVGLMRSQPQIKQSRQSA
jgi:cell division protein FtsW